MMRKRLAFFGVLVFVFALALPSRAFAWDICGDGVWWRGNTSDGMFGVCVHADNEFDAAAYCFYGYDPDSMPSDVRSKLSDPNYGGRFYEYAQTFTHMEDLTQYPDWLPAYVGVGNVLGNGLIVGFTSTGFYTSEVESSLYFGAKEDFSRVLAGEDLGGGGSGTVPVGDYYSVPVSAQADTEPASTANKESYRHTAQNATYSDGDLIIGSGTTKYSSWLNNSAYVSSGVVYASSDFLSLADTYINQGYDVCFTTNFSSVNLVYGNNLVVQYGNHGAFYNYSLVGSNLHRIGVRTTAYYDSTNGLFCFVADGPFGDAVPISSSFRNEYFSQVYVSPFFSPPSGDWPEPETPVTPDPPEVPTPTAPTETPDPDPTAPTVVWPTAPIVVNPPEVTVEVTPSGIDYTELLTLINDNLNSIDAYTQAINSCLNSLRADIVGGFDDVVTSLRNVYQYLTHLNDVLEVHCKHIRDSIDQNVYELELYLKSLFEWLPRQLDYDAQFTYDDSAVTTLLYRILNKIPGGSTATPTTYMPNPQADEPGFFDWLLDLWHRFLIDLVSVLPDELGGLVDAFSQLTHYFPISIPWDIYALLALFEHEPVTPVFDLPWGYGGGEGEIQNVRVDLSCWDSVMAFIRPVFVVGFCIKLALITKDLLSNFDINKGGI